MSVETDPLSPVPQHTKPIDEKSIGNAKHFEKTWLRWFIELRDKVNVINAILVALANVTGTGFPSFDGTVFNMRQMQPGPGVDVANPDGVAGNPTFSFNADTGEIAHEPGATYTTVQKMLDVLFSPGVITGCEVTALNPTTVRITAGTMLFRILDDNVSELRFANIASADFAVPDIQTTHFYAADYNGGSPVFVQATVDVWDRDTEIPVGSAFRFDGVLNVTPNPYKVGDILTNIIQRFDAVGPVLRDNSVGGLLLAVTGVRNVTLSAGRIWARISDFAVPAKISTVDTLFTAFFNGVNLTITGGATQWDNLNFNNMGTGSLQVLGNNKYANIWFFLSFDGAKWGFAYGTQEHNTLGDAALEGVPPYLTQNFFNQALLLGRFVFQKNAATPSIIDSAFANVAFTPTAINDHNLLSGLQVAPNAVANEYYHMSGAQATNVDALNTVGTGMLAKIGVATYAGRTIGGTANRITLLNGDGIGGQPTIDIASTYVGQTSITTLGTIGTGTWNATIIAPGKLGTGVPTSATFLRGDGVWSATLQGPFSAVGNIASVGVTTETRSIEVGTGRTGDGISHIDLVGDTTYSDYGLRLIRNAGANSASQIEHRGTGSFNIIASEAAPISLRTFGTERVNISSLGVVSVLMTTAVGGFASGVGWNGAAGSARRASFRTAGVLRWDLGADGTAESGANAGTNFILNRYDDAGALLGTAINVTRSSGNIAFSGTITSGTWNGTAIGPTFGGTGQTTYVLGDILYANAANSLARLAGNTVATRRFLSQTGVGVSSAAPIWADITGTDITGAALTKTDDTNVTLTLGGSPTTALLRATSLTLGWTGVLQAARGGTGQSTYNVGDILYSNSPGDLARLPGNITTTTTYLRSIGNGVANTSTQWGQISGVDVIGSALTKVDDTNVTLTLGGLPTIALLNATSLTLGWTGTLAASRGGTGIGSYTAGNYINALNATTLQQRTPAQVLTDIAAVAKAGDTMTGDLTISRGATAGGMFVDTNAGVAGDVRWLSGGALRWIMRKDTTAEGGGNTGSNWVLMSRTDAGGALLNVISANRATGQVDFGGSITIPQGAITSGTYTPTLTSVTNIAAIGAAVATNYMRVGNVVTVSGRATITPTANATPSEFAISLPIASNFNTGLSNTCNGTAVSENVSDQMTGQILPDDTNDRARVLFYARGTAARFFSFQFTYLII